MLEKDWQKYFNAVESTRTLIPTGKVTKITGIIAEGYCAGTGVGSTCSIENTEGTHIHAEVVGFNDRKIVLMPYGETRNISPGCKISLLEDRPYIPVGNQYLGRVIGGMGEPIDGLGPIQADDIYPLYGNVVNPLNRQIITEPVDVGVGVINTMITIGKGQRIAIMAGSGVGKSVLMGMIARHTAADVSIICLVGERGREVKDFVEHILGKEGRQKSILVAATSDTSPLVRIRSTYLATTLAEYFRDQGKDVLLIMDSITRFAMSSRDVGLAAGEPPTLRGYTPSFFIQIPKLLERAGNVEGKGSITGIYTVLVEGDDINDPVGDTVRSIVDGHIVLSRDLANMGHYPAIDVLGSVSRVMRDVIDRDHYEIAQRLIEILAIYKKSEDIINIGAYVDGSDPKIDYAKSMIGKINEFLRQRVEDKVSMNVGVNQLKLLFLNQPNMR
ncbi:flagellum-specific ATP synthase [Candidatus Magnetomorum sp. HK-1]|nr:flagellum-specific ATP synthase [Candidatus Magnetomorum sp. HK-1]